MAGAEGKRERRRRKWTDKKRGERTKRKMGGGRWKRKRKMGRRSRIRNGLEKEGERERKER